MSAVSVYPMCVRRAGASLGWATELEVVQPPLCWT
uniref:Uncharacterized protein n=1 Tax=Anguilla anguilla TaxID=7936 RepID=A0A0E9VE63_ANGAN